jgi:hypothetical protein
VGSDVMRFVTAVFSHWQAYVTGGGITAILAVIERLSSWRLPKKYYAVLITAGFLSVATFLAWRDEHRAAEAAKIAQGDAEKRLGEMNTPKLVGRINSVGVAPTGKHENDSIIVMVATIKDAGAPSIVQGLRAEVTLRDGRTLPLQELPHLLGDIILRTEKGTKLRVLSTDYLPDKAGSQPIPRNGAVSGFYWGVVRGANRESVDATGSRVTLFFNDINDKPYELQFTLGGPQLGIINPWQLQRH